MKKLLIFAAFLAFIPQMLFALNMSAERNVYAEAVQLQNNKNWEKANKKAQLISKYPLVYLLQYKFLKTHFDVVSREKIKQFINDNPLSSASNDLERAYLYYLAAHKRWRDYLEFYPNLPRLTALRCFQAEAKISQGKFNEAWQETRKIWLTGQSIPNSCDVVINHYILNGKIDQKLIWQRFHLAFEDNVTLVMIHLKTLLEGDKKVLAGRIIRLNKHLGGLLTTNIFVNKNSDSFSFLLTLIHRLANRNFDKGLVAYYAYDLKFIFTEEENKTLEGYFAALIIQNDKKNYFEWLDTFLGDLGSDSLIEQRLRYAIRFNNWRDLNYWISQLSPALQKHPRWLYWQARILERKHKHHQANKIYVQLAKKRSYYGFLSAQKVGVNYEFNEHLITQKGKRLLLLKGLLAKIEELKYQGDNNRSKREWKSLLGKSDVKTQQQVGLYAFNKGWTHLSILASISSKSWNALNIRFPKAAPLIFTEQSNKYGLEPTYIYAIVRQESAFDEAASSPVGAKGFMQLMPYTAKYMAKKIGLKNYPRASQLQDGKINVPLGTAYFAMVLKRYNGNRVLATAAYNAGPQRVNRWKKDQKGRDSVPLPMDSWIESIPYKETRDYVKNVLAYNVIYQHILKKRLKFFNRKELKARY